MENQRRANYSFGEKIKCVKSLIYTKIFWRNARLIRLPSYIRGKKAIKYGTGFTTGYNCRIECNGVLDKTRLIIGRNCVIGDYCHIVANSSVTIGDNVLIASRVFITDSNHGKYSGQFQSNPKEIVNERPMSYENVKIGDNVWIGENVSILSGVTIGDGSIIGANSVVTKNIACNTLAVGSPAKQIKKYLFSEQKWIKVEANE